MPPRPSFNDINNYPGRASFGAWPKGTDRGPVYWAAYWGYTDIISRLVDLGFSLDEPKKETGKTPLFAALEQGNDDTLKFLLANGASVQHLDRKGQSLFQMTSGLHQRAYNSQKPAWAKRLSLLIAHGTQLKAQALSDWSLFLWLADQGYSELLNEVLLKGVSIDEQDTQSKKTALMLAASHGNTQLFHFLLDHGANRSLTDSEGRTALVHALLGYDKEMVPYGKKMIQPYKEIISLLIEQKSPLMEVGFDGWSELIWATQFNETTFAMDLLALGADAKTVLEKNGWNCLHFAANNGNELLTTHFLTLGLDANSQTKEGETPLYLAAKAFEQKNDKRRKTERERARRTILALLGASAKPQQVLLNGWSFDTWKAKVNWQP